MSQKEPGISKALKTVAINGLGSRKSWAAISGVLAIALAPKLGWPPEKIDTLVNWIGAITTAYLGGQSLVDALLKRPPLAEQGPGPDDVSEDDTRMIDPRPSSKMQRIDNQGGEL